MFFWLAFVLICFRTFSRITSVRKGVLFFVPHTQWSQLLTYAIFQRFWAKARVVRDLVYLRLKSEVIVLLF